MNYILSNIANFNEKKPCDNAGPGTAEMFVCGVYYEFRDYHMCSHFYASCLSESRINGLKDFTDRVVLKKLFCFHWHPCSCLAVITFGVKTLLRLKRLWRAKKNSVIMLG